MLPCPFPMTIIITPRCIHILDSVDTESTVFNDSISQLLVHQIKSLPSSLYPFVYCCAGHDGKGNLVCVAF